MSEGTELYLKLDFLLYSLAFSELLKKVYLVEVKTTLLILENRFITFSDFILLNKSAN